MGEFDTARTDAALEKVFESKDKKSKEEKLLEYLRKVDPTILQDVLKKLTKQS